MSTTVTNAPKDEPRCMKIRDIKHFTAVSAVHGFCFGLFPLYTVSQVTTLEKHFDLSSQWSGMIVSGSEIGFIFSALLIGYFSNHYHRPRILGYCSILICLGALICTIPFYLHMNNYKDPNFGPLASMNKTCGAKNSIDCDDVTMVRSDDSSSFWYFLVGTMLYGAGSCGMWTIGVSYIDDNSDRKKSYFYLGLVICVRFLAPVGGMLLGAAVVQVPVHLAKTLVGPDSPDFVGAWWLGYYVILGLVLISSIPFWFYPKVLSANEAALTRSKYAADNVAMDDDASIATPHTQTYGSTSTSKLDEEDIGGSRSVAEREGICGLLKGFPSALWRLAKNPIFMFGALATSLDFAISIGFGAFVPKYFEVYFHTNPTIANLITGVALAFSACIGSGLGGFLMSRIKWPLSRMVLVATLVNIGVCVLSVPMVFLNCPGAHMEGIFSSPPDFASACNSGCDCQASSFSPVCVNQTAFYSACHAGCQQELPGGTFSDCACASPGDVLAPGLCTEQCTLEMGVYASLMFLLVMFLSAAEIPAYMLNIRSVGEQDKSLALAVLNVFTSAFIFPMPIIFGMLVDGACLVLQKFACSDGAACMFYDNDQLKYRLHLVMAGMKIVPTILYLAAWFLARNKLFAGDEKVKVKEVHENAAAEDSNGTKL